MYKLYKTSSGADAVVKTNDDGSTSSFVFDENNSNYQAYLIWLAEGNTPEPAENI